MRTVPASQLRRAGLSQHAEPPSIVPFQRGVWLTPEFSCGTLPHQAQSQLQASEARQPLIMMRLKYRQLQRTLAGTVEVLLATFLQNWPAWRRVPHVSATGGSTRENVGRRASTASESPRLAARAYAARHHSIAFRSCGIG